MTNLEKTKGSTNTKSFSKKGGNFWGSVGELVAPSGWESFVSTAGLFALDRADAALRRGNGKADKTNKKSGGGADGSASGKTMRKKYTRKQVGGNIDELTGLIFNNIPPFIDGIPASGIVPEWTPYIRIRILPSYNQPNARMSVPLEATELLESLINTKNSRGQTPLYLACTNSNFKLYNLLRRFGANPEIKNGNNSTILHGIAWGNDDRPSGPPTYQEKITMLQQIIGTVPELIFSINANGETFFHNLMFKHPETIPSYTKTHICTH